jgi:DNA-binding response OmpR family regulator
MRAGVELRKEDIAGTQTVPAEGGLSRRTVLVVEDEPTMATVLRYNLEREGYRCVVAADGARALELARDEHPNLLLLDVMLPGIDGIEVCRRIRAQSSVPIILLTARVEEMGRVVGLDVGADDYVTKPFSMRELLARVRALLRRAAMLTPKEATRLPLIPLLPGLIIDPNRREVVRDDRPIALKPKEFDLLLFLARHPRRVFTRDQLLEQVWGYEFAAQSRTVDVHVRWLREKIEPNPGHPICLLTARGIGYRLELGQVPAT